MWAVLLLVSVLTLLGSSMRTRLPVVASEPESSIECSDFKARDVSQQCSNPEARELLGSKVDDRYACAVACREKARLMGQPVCCVYTMIDSCVAYPNGGPIVPGKGQTPGSKVSYRGSATLCGPNKEQTFMSSLFSMVYAVYAGSDEPPIPRNLDEAGTLVARDQANRHITAMSAQEVAIFRNINPQEIVQGSLGDCWLMAAIASMAHYPLAVRKLFHEKFISTDGLYTIQLYDLSKNKWVRVSIDSAVPAGRHDPLYAQLAKDRAGWVLLLEKAIAKLSPLQNRSIAGYGNLDGAWSEVAVALLTGSTKTRTFSFNGSEIQADVRTWTGEGKYYSYHKTSVTHVDVWKALVRGTQESKLMVGSIHKRNASATAESRLANGLYDGHAYSILQAKFFDPAQPAQACIGEIEVVYRTSEEFMADKRHMKKYAWDSSGPSRFMGGTWETSRAARWGVGIGWTLVDENVFSQAVPRGTSVRRVSFQGVIDVGSCSSRAAGPYSNTRMKEFPVTSLKEPIRLVQVRNPWGNHRLFTGAWSDSDTKEGSSSWLWSSIPAGRWRQHTDVALAAGFAPLDDGMWWMTLEEFIQNFNMLSIGEVNMHKFSPHFYN